MSRNRSIVVTVVVAVLCGSGLSACADERRSAVASGCKPAAKVQTIHKGKLTVAIAEFPPYISAKNGTPSGIDGVLINRIAKNLCLELDARTTSFPAITSGLQSGKVDLSAGSWTITPERKKMFEVSEPVYKSFPGAVSKEGWNTIDQFKGHSVGTTTGYFWVSGLQRAIGADHVKLYQSEQSAYDDLKAGRIQAGLFTEGTVASFMKKDGNPSNLQLKILAQDPKVEFTMEEPVTGVLIHKGETELLSAVNQQISDFQNSGELAKELSAAGISKESLIQN